MKTGLLTREGLWRRVSGASLWSLPWAMAAACAVPWLLPERWAGQLPRTWLAAGGAVLLLSLPLFRAKAWRVIPMALSLSGFVLLGLQRLARWELALPTGFQDVQGHIAAPWRIQGERRVSRLAVRVPEALSGCELPLALPLEGEPAPAPGTPVRLRAELQSIDPAPAYLAERPLWRARDSGAPRRVFLRSAQLLEILGPPAPSPLLRLQAFVERRFQALPLPEGPARDLWGALTLGLPPAREDSFSAFAESGTIHTLVVSGLQVTLVMAALEALWRRLARRGSSLAAAGGGLLYAALVGFSAPVWRGLVMGLAWSLGRSKGWQLPPVLTLHGALLLWLLAHPAAGCDPGFLLAWWALLGVIWGAEPLAGFLSPMLGRGSLPAARFAAPWFTTLPFLALFHGGAPLWGVFANVLVLPLVALLTPVCLGLILVPVPALVMPLGLGLNWMGRALVPFFARIAPLATGSLWPWLALALGWILLGQRQGRLVRSRALAVTLAAGSIALVALRGTGRAPDALSLEAVDVGQGDALLLRVPGGNATVVDTGPSPWAARRLVRVLSRRGVREPVDLVVTHPHGDHAGGWATLARLWPMASIRVPETADGEEDWRSVAPPELYHRARTVLRGEAWHSGEAHYSIRWPPRAFRLPDANEYSLVLKVEWRRRDIWLMGDTLALQGRDLLDLGDPGSVRSRPLLKVGHHGGAGALDAGWLAALRPGAAVITAGRRNSFGFPASETLDLLEAAGCGEIHLSGPAYGVRLEADPWASPGGWRVETGQP